MEILLDTNAYSRFITFREWETIISEASHIYLPLIAVAELRAGFLKGTRTAANEKTLRDFCDRKNVSILSPDLPTSFQYAAIYNHLRLTGHSIPVHDVWIAALAIQHGLWLCTSDAHFDHIPQLLRVTS